MGIFDNTPFKPVQDLAETAKDILNDYTPAPEGLPLPDGGRVPPPLPGAGAGTGLGTYYGEQCEDGTREVFYGKVVIRNGIPAVEKILPIYECQPGLKLPLDPGNQEAKCEGVRYIVTVTWPPGSSHSASGIYTGPFSVKPQFSGLTVSNYWWAGARIVDGTGEQIAYGVWFESTAGYNQYPQSPEILPTFTIEREDGLEDNCSGPPLGEPITPGQPNPNPPPTPGPQYPRPEPYAPEIPWPGPGTRPRHNPYNPVVPLPPSPNPPPDMPGIDPPGTPPRIVPQPPEDPFVRPPRWIDEPPDWIINPPTWVAPDGGQDCPSPCPDLDLSPVLVGIANVLAVVAQLKVDISNEFNISLSNRVENNLTAIVTLLNSLDVSLATRLSQSLSVSLSNSLQASLSNYLEVRLTAILTAISNIEPTLIASLRVELNNSIDASINNSLAIRLDPKLDLAISRINLLQIELQADLTTIINALINLNLALDLKLDFLLQAIIDVKAVLLAAILNVELNPTIEFSPTINVDPIVQREIEIIEIEKPVIQREVEIIEIEKEVEIEVEVEKEPPTENVLLPTIECDEDGNPVSNPVVVRTLVGAIPVETQEKFHEMAKLAIEQCKDENDDGCNVVLPSDCYSEYQLESQLIILFGNEYPKQTGSKWRIHIPNPIDKLNWCEHFESLKWYRGTVYGRLYFDGQCKLITGGYFQSESEAYRVLEQLGKLSKYENNNIRVTKHTKPKRTVAGVLTRAVRASTVFFDKDGNVTKGDCWRPPADGC